MSFFLRLSFCLALSISLSFSFVQVFDYVICATGHFSVPNVPHFPGFESFEGRVLHAHDFRTMPHQETERQQRERERRGRERQLDGQAGGETVGERTHLTCRS